MLLFHKIATRLSLTTRVGKNCNNVVGGRRVARGACSTHVGGRRIARGSTYGGPGRCNGHVLYKSNSHTLGGWTACRNGLPQLKEISFKMTITLGGGININCIYYTIF